MSQDCPPSLPITDHSSPPRLSVVIVSFNVRDLLRDCLRSLRAAETELPLQVLVVENGSADDSAAMVAREFPEVELLDLGHNAGFSAANNRAIERARAAEILLLNPDTVVPPRAFRHRSSKWTRFGPSRCPIIG